MKITKLKQFNSQSKKNMEDRGSTEWYLSCGMLLLFFLGLLAVLGIIFIVFGKIILTMFMTS
ncbi:MAG: hypothetical protein ACK5MD_08960 [Flavobacteriales bacterium]